MKKLHPEVLENRALFSVLSCSTQFEMDASCTLGQSVYFQTTDQVVGGSGVIGPDYALLKGGVVKFFSEPEDLNHFKYDMHNVTLAFYGTGSISGTIATDTYAMCNFVTGRSGVEGAAPYETVCSFDNGGISGGHTKSAGGFLAPVSFPLATLKAVEAASDQLIYAGQLVISGQATLTRYTDTDLGSASISLAWCPTVTDSQGTNFAFDCSIAGAPAPVVGINTGTALTCSGGGVTCSGHTAIKDPNLNWDNVKGCPASSNNDFDVGCINPDQSSTTVPPARARLFEKVMALYPLD